MLSALGRSWQKVVVAMAAVAAIAGALALQAGDAGSDDSDARRAPTTTAPMFDWMNVPDDKDAAAAAIEDARASGALGGDLDDRPNALPEPGIYDEPLEQDWPSEGLVLNMWVGSLAGRYVELSAGSAGRPYRRDGRGFVGVNMMDWPQPDQEVPQNQTLKLYLAPEGYNGIRVTKVEGDRVTLRSDTGRVLYFSLRAARFSTA